MIGLSFGDPAPYVERVYAAGIPVLSQINTIEDMRLAEAAGVDVIVAQGGEAGGHTGHIGTLPLLQEVLEATDLPVLAAGGIATGRGLAAVLAAGGLAAAGASLEAGLLQAAIRATGRASRAVGSGPKLTPIDCSHQVSRITMAVPKAMVSPWAKLENRRMP